MTREEAISRIKAVEDFAIRLAKDFEKCDYEAFDMAIKALEQEQKSEWEHDHEILKAYSDGANEVLDKIRAEMVDLGQRTMNNNRASGIWTCVDIIDKYKAESEK